MTRDDSRIRSDTQTESRTAIPIHKKPAEPVVLFRGVALDRPARRAPLLHTQSLKMFAVANTSALRVAAKAPVKARRTVAPKAALVADLKKAAKKAAPAILTATTTMLPAAAALAEEEVTPVDLKLAIGFTVAIGIAAFSTLPEPESSKHGGDH